MAEDSGQSFRLPVCLFSNDPGNENSVPACFRSREWAPGHHVRAPLVSPPRPALTWIVAAGFAVRDARKGPA